MAGIHQTCVETAEEYAAPGRDAAGANIAGFLRVSRAMLAFGLISAQLRRPHRRWTCRFGVGARRRSVP